ncbi:Galactose mutarotase-like superfamily protein [Actinidia rufa]|uniref:glucose-6-phosphate 1-epimerase n=1 Tax=Actinidia rufa TaxID=165716 RepID=A0A7J0GAY1_9ERIC|nr:Galactose mutarotase-like superfamily protein [Actinidia rufa]
MLTKGLPSGLRHFLDMLDMRCRCEFQLPFPLPLLSIVYLYGGQVTSWKNDHGEELLFVSSKSSNPRGYCMDHPGDDVDRLVKMGSRSWCPPHSHTKCSPVIDGLSLFPSIPHVVIHLATLVGAPFKPPKAIRGGIPICFPQFGIHGHLEQHGFARNRFWSIDHDPPPFPTNSSNKAFVDLILKHSEEDAKIWPYSEVRIEGLETLDYLDNLQDRQRFTEQGDAITFESEVDKIYVSTPTKIAILDHEKKRTFVLRKDGLPDAVVWNPWDKKAKLIPDLGDEEYKHMLCVEAAAVAKPITLKPGEEWKGRQELSAVPSSYCSGQLDPQKVLQGS